MGTLDAVAHPPSAPPRPRKVITVSSNKGGVGKTTIATNLAIYLRALHEELPVLLVGLDDQSIIDRMFRLGRAEPGEPNLKHAWAERSFDAAIQLGQYGIHFVPSPPDTALLKARAEDPSTLRRILAHTAFAGVVLVDTKSDLEALTLNALLAADLAILPVSDFASFEEAAKAFTLLERHGASGRGRVLFSLVDRRTRVDEAGHDLYERLAATVEERGWPRFETYLSRSPRVEALNSAGGAPGSVLHHARGTLVHRQFRELAEELSKLADLGPPSSRVARPPSPVATRPGSLKEVLLRGLGRR
jgi:chromosome partitioning protein